LPLENHPKFHTVASVAGSGEIAKVQREIDQITGHEEIHQLGPILHNMGHRLKQKFGELLAETIKGKNHSRLLLHDCMYTVDKLNNELGTGILNMEERLPMAFMQFQLLILANKDLRGELGTMVKHWQG
jgi:phosphopentomutase